jgi:hypothetical protein
MTNEHRGDDQLTKKQEESMIELKTYKNLLVGPNSSTMLGGRGQGRRSQPNRFKIKTLMIYNETLPKIPSTSISCAQQNRNEEDMPQIKTITLKDQIQQPIPKYILPHLKKVDKF